MVASQHKHAAAQIRHEAQPLLDRRAATGDDPDERRRLAVAAFHLVQRTEELALTREQRRALNHCGKLGR